MSSSSATPAPVRAETKQIGMRCPSRSACSNGACSSVGFDFALLEIARHQLFVDLDDLVDQRLVRVLDRGEVRFARTG